MTHRTAHRGASTRFLALLASSTMIVAGLAGVAAAGPASATPFVNGVDVYLNNPSSTSAGDSKEDCVPGLDGWLFIVTADDWDTTNISFTNGAPVTVGAPQQMGNGSFHIFVTTKVGATLNPGSTYITDVQIEQGNPVFTLSHSCAGTETPPDTSLIVNKKWIGMDEVASKIAEELGPEDAGKLMVTINKTSPSQWAWDTKVSDLTEGDTVAIEETDLPDGVDPELVPEGYTCWVVSNDEYPAFDAKNFSLEGGDNEATVTNAVACTDEPVSELTVHKRWVGINGSASEQLAEKLGPDDAGDLKVWVGEKQTEQDWEETYKPLPPNAWAWIQEDVDTFPSLDPEDIPSGYTCEIVVDAILEDTSEFQDRAVEKTLYPDYSRNGFYLEEGTNEVTVTNAVECTEIPVTPPPPTGGNPPVTTTTPETPVTTQAVAEAQVVAPVAQAAAAPAPANVAIPAKATLPAAVPAGDGSEAPGLPLWALALMLVGLLGAGFSAKSWVASRK